MPVAQTLVSAASTHSMSTLAHPSHSASRFPSMTLLRYRKRPSSADSALDRKMLARRRSDELLLSASRDAGGDRRQDPDPRERQSESFRTPRVTVTYRRRMPDRRVLYQSAFRGRPLGDRYPRAPLQGAECRKCEGFPGSETAKERSAFRARRRSQISTELDARNSRKRQADGPAASRFLLPDAWWW